ncbi:uncharacterized protein TM35_000431590 [Trypanosoma theileri]|uniref:Transmembrane protein n=1 Tax=Trypanosoma theileri TaxID=67003 RepID=A0A1X0NJ34_9TRYP|nr:uncharacterized protein TM35_000431590 [Trypanosoma theileri]ORC84591.1 hypothetical protein TM35_000431590 [Trypanosoma theileri]
MQPVEGTFRYRVREVLSRLWSLAVPNDRPMPLFTMCAVLFNGGFLVYSFSVVLSATCSIALTRWSALGLTNIMVNIVYAIAIMWRMRFRIDEGIPLECNVFRLFFMEPVNIAFVVYVLWEMVWMSFVPQMTTMYGVLDICSTHLSLQFWFCGLFILLSVPVLILTFMTEFCRVPRWRRWADEKWQRQQRTMRIVRTNVSAVLREELPIVLANTSLRSVPQQQRQNQNQQQHQVPILGDSKLVPPDASNIAEVGFDLDDFVHRASSRENSRHMANSCFSPREGDDGWCPMTTEGHRQELHSPTQWLPDRIRSPVVPPARGISNGSAAVFRTTSDDTVVNPGGIYISVGQKNKDESEGHPSPKSK